MPDSETHSVRPPDAIRTLAGKEPALLESEDSEGVSEKTAENPAIENDALQNASRDRAAHTQPASEESRLSGDSEETASLIYRFPARMRFDS